jgi:hypothetical protein
MPPVLCRRGLSVSAAIDLEKFFDRVNHDILMEFIAKRIADKRILKLMRAFLTAGVMGGGLVSPTENNTPEGDPLSPFGGRGAVEIEFAAGAGMRITGAVDAAMLRAAMAAPAAWQLPGAREISGEAGCIRVRQTAPHDRLGRAGVLDRPGANKQLSAETGKFDRKCPAQIRARRS